MFLKKLTIVSFNLSLLFGGIAAVLCTGAAYRFRFMIFALLFGFIGFGLCCLHIIMAQREEDENIKLVSTPKLILSLVLNSSPLISMVMLIWLAKHGR